MQSRRVTIAQYKQQTTAKLDVRLFLGAHLRLFALIPFRKRYGPFVDKQVFCKYRSSIVCPG